MLRLRTSIVIALALNSSFAMWCDGAEPRDFRKIANESHLAGTFNNPFPLGLSPAMERAEATKILLAASRQSKDTIHPADNEDRYFGVPFGYFGRATVSLRYFEDRLTHVSIGFSGADTKLIVDSLGILLGRPHSPLTEDSQCSWRINGERPAMVIAYRAEIDDDYNRQLSEQDTHRHPPDWYQRRVFRINYDDLGPYGIKEDPQRAALVGLLEDDPTSVASALDAGFDISKCPRMVALDSLSLAKVSPYDPLVSEKPQAPWCGAEQTARFNSQLNENAGYNFLYWVAEYGSDRLKKVVRDRGFVLPGDASLSAKEKALLARFELLHIAWALDQNPLPEGAGAWLGRSEEDLYIICKTSGAKAWSRRYPLIVQLRAGARFVESGFKDPFGNPYEFSADGSSPLISQATIAAAANSLGAKSESFWQPYLPPPATK